MISFGSTALVFPVPEPIVCSSIVEVLLFFIDHSMISSQKTPYGTGKHWDPMFAKLSTSSLLALLTCETLHP
jgi:hypothetical protein